MMIVSSSILSIVTVYCSLPFQDVLKCTDNSVVLKTIQRLPIDAVIPLLKELHHRLHTKWIE